MSLKNWDRSLEHQQLTWIEHPKHEIVIRYDSLMREIEAACLVTIRNGQSGTKVQILGDVVESCAGIEPYRTEVEGQSNIYIKPRRDLPSTETEWQPLLDGSSFIGRYELLWDSTQPFIKYGNWLSRPRESRFFDLPKLLVQAIRNRNLKRRLVATYDEQRFYNRKNFINIIATRQSVYNLKYILALFNSSLLNFWYSNRFDNVNINPSYFRQLPIYPADMGTQTEFVELVDKILVRNVALNQLRELGYTIRDKRNGNRVIEVPYNQLLDEIHRDNPNFSTLSLFDAKAVQLFSIPESCDLQETISSNVYIPTKYPNTVVLRHNKLWLEIPDEDVRKFLLGYLKSPLWQGKNWDQIKNSAQIPAEAGQLSFFFAREEQKRREIQTLLDEVIQIDAEIDEKVLNLYGITNPVDRQRILGSAPIVEEEGNQSIIAAENEED